MIYLYLNYQVFPGDRIIVPGGKPPGLLSVMFEWRLIGGFPDCRLPTNNGR